MADEASTSPSDVEKHISTDLSTEDIQDWIDDAEDAALRWNRLRDFDPGELDRLVKFYAAYLIAKSSDNDGDVKQVARGGRSVTLKTADEFDRGFLATRVRANDPSGKVLGGRAATKSHTIGGGGSYHDEEDDCYGR